MAKKVYDPIHDVFEDISKNRGDTVESAGRARRGTRAMKVQEETPTSHKYSRHLKKPDGEWFTREDLQYGFLHKLLDDHRPLFVNMFKDFYRDKLVPFTSDELADEDPEEVINVTNPRYNARRFVFNEKLTFGQHYVLTLASSSKCSKVLREKLLSDQGIAFSTSVLSLLINFGRLNTTINFYLEMTSQMRTYHAVPSLQLYSQDNKPLQDTPRLKSILKNLPIGNDNIESLDLWWASEPVKGRFNLVNLIFRLLENPTFVNDEILRKIHPDMNIFELVDHGTFPIECRSSIVIWLLALFQNHTHIDHKIVEDTLDEFGISREDIALLQNPEPEIDPPLEKEFGDSQKNKRSEFMSKLRPPTKTRSSSNSGGNTGGTRAKKEIVDDTVAADVTVGEVTTIVEEDEEEPVVQEEVSEPDKIKSEEPKNTSSVPDAYSKPNESTSKYANILIDYDNKRSSLYMPDMLRLHEYSGRKRREVGLLKVFNKYEDITLAPIIGIRGKKRSKFKTPDLEYETSFLTKIHRFKKRFLKLRQAEHLDETADPRNEESIFKVESSN